MNSDDDSFSVSHTSRSTLVRLSLDNAPKITVGDYFAPMIPDTVKAEVDESGSVTKMEAVGVVASKTGARTKRPTKVFCFRKAYEEEVPDWLKREIRKALDD